MDDYNYAVVDRILDTFDGVFKEIKIIYHLTNASIERWRWDIPEIRLSWKAADAIWRNINIFINISQIDKIDKIVGSIEVNAWLDVQKDNRWIRRWQHAVVIENAPVDPQIAQRCYQIVAEWNPEKLIHEQPLSEPTSTWLDQQRS